MPLAAAPALLGDVAQRYHALQQGNACALLYEGWQVLVLPDERSRAVAIVVTAGREKGKGAADMVALGLAEKLYMGEVQSFAMGEDAALVMRDALVAGVSGSLLDKPAAVMLGHLLAANYYHPAAVTPEGRLIMKSGKKRSIDLSLPLAVGNVKAVELLVTGIEVDTHAANVLAKKLGNPADATSAADKKRIKSELKVSEVAYALNNPTMVMVQAKDKRWYFGEKAEVARMLRSPAAALKYPQPTAPAAPVPPKAQPAATHETPKENRPLTPAEALKIYIQRLSDM